MESLIPYFPGEAHNIFVGPSSVNPKIPKFISEVLKSLSILRHLNYKKKKKVKEKRKKRQVL